MLRYLAGLGVLLFTWLVPVTFSYAALVFEFGVGGTPQTSIQIAGPGKTVDIQVFLSQYSVDGEPNLAIDGLFSAGIRVTLDNPMGIAGVQDLTHIAQGPEFDFVSSKLTATTAELNEAIFSDPFAVFPDDEGRILLGTFRFTGLALGSTIITVSDLNEEAGFDDLVTGFMVPLDDLIASGSATLTVTPEPGSIALSLLMIGAASVVTSCRRRRRRSQQGADEACPAGEASL